jgi:hypothetical protein
MKNNSLMLLMGTLAAEGILWKVAPGLATMAGVVLGLFMIASWCEGSKAKHSNASTISNNVEDFQRRVGAGAF